MTESMTEITKALRCCADSKCGECNRLNNGIREDYVCSNDLHKVAADTIDRLTAENARLDEELGRCTSGNGTYISLESHNRILAKLTEKLIAEITDYRALAAEYGIDGKTMLTLAKSQIETAKENANLTARLAAAVEDLSGCCDTCAFCNDCAKHDNNDSSAGFTWWTDCEDWKWRGEESE